MSVHAAYFYFNNSPEQLPMVTGNLFANVPEQLANEAVEEWTDQSVPTIWLAIHYQ